MAEKAFAQDLIPHTISSDLQQFNVVRPVKSLANVMSAMLRLGMTLPQVIERVTLQSGQGDFADGSRRQPQARHAGRHHRVPRQLRRVRDLAIATRRCARPRQQIEPLITFKNGKRFDANMAMGQEESNWFLQIAEDHIPNRASKLTERQRGFLNSLAENLASTSWEVSSAERLDIEKALELQDTFHQAAEQAGAAVEGGAAGRLCLLFGPDLHNADRSSARASRAAICDQPFARCLRVTPDRGLEEGAFMLHPKLPIVQSEQNIAGSLQMTEQPWQPLMGLRPDNTKYPARASLEGEGIVILKTKSGYRGVQRSCPHMKATMLNAELTANDTMVRCPLHVFTFKLSDGKGVNCPGFKVKVYEIKEENGALYGRIAN